MSTGMGSNATKNPFSGQIVSAVEKILRIAGRHGDAVE
jgi:hypothetical protein